MESQSYVKSIKLSGNTLYWYTTLEILLTVSNLAIKCQLAVIRVLIDCLLNILWDFILMGPQHSDYKKKLCKDMSTYSTKANLTISRHVVAN